MEAQLLARVGTADLDQLIAKMPAGLVRRAAEETRDAIRVLRPGELLPARFAAGPVAIEWQGVTAAEATASLYEFVAGTFGVYPED